MKMLVILGLILLVLSSHWICAHLYVHACVPSGIMGFLQTMVGLGSPMCGFLMQMQTKTAEYYSILWLGCGLTLINVISSYIGGQNVKEIKRK